MSDHAAHAVTAAVPEPAFYDDLALTLDEAWRLLQDAAIHRRNAFHQPVLATTGEDGAADARVVVLRAASRSERSLHFHTDQRAGKVAELMRDPRAMVVAYDPISKVQLRLSGQVSIHQHDPLADAAWAATRRFSRQCYRVAQPSGSVLSHPQEADFQPAADDHCGAAVFCVLRLTVERLEWLYLSAAGHRRARFAWQAQDWCGQWLVP